LAAADSGEARTAADGGETKGKWQPVWIGEWGREIEREREGELGARMDREKWEGSPALYRQRRRRRERNRRRHDAAS
jgi:hypothetical protein